MSTILCFALARLFNGDALSSEVPSVPVRRLPQPLLNRIGQRILGELVPSQLYRSCHLHFILPWFPSTPGGMKRDQVPGVYLLGLRELQPHYQETH